MRLTDDEAVKAVEHDTRCYSEAYQNDRIQMLEACLKSTVRELLITLEEDSSDKESGFEYCMFCGNSLRQRRMRK